MTMRNTWLQRTKAVMECLAAKGVAYEKVDSKEITGMRNGSVEQASSPVSPVSLLIRILEYSEWNELEERTDD